MANNTNNHNDQLSNLPAELRRMIWEFLLEGNRLWVGHYGSQVREMSIIRRFITHNDTEPISNYPPHPMFYVNRLIAEEIRRLWPTRFIGNLQVDDTLVRFPHQAFSGVTHLSLTMEQAAGALEVTIPRIPNHGHWHIPNTELVLAHGLPIRRLRITWALPFFIDNPFGPSQTHIQTTLIRLQYFRRSFRVVIYFQAAESTGQRQVLASGTIRDGANNANFADVEMSFHLRAAQRPNLQGAFVASLADFGWDPQQHVFLPFGPQFDATVNAHPHHDYVPLGYLTPMPGSPTTPPRHRILPGSNPFNIAPNPFVAAPRTPTMMATRRRNPSGPQPDPAARRLHPRLFDWEVTGDE